MSIAEKYRPHYTYDDYVEWEGRWELIEGMPYAMSPLPVPEHQRINLKLCMLFETALSDCNKCKVYPPIDWKISDDTVVQPDVLIVCKKIGKKFLDFPPALVIEILSPSTASKDRNEKMELYMEQKVKYYCIVDSQFKRVEIYELQNGTYQPASLHSGNFQFHLDACTADVNFENIWE